MKGLKWILVGVGLLFVLAIAIAIIAGMSQQNQQKKEQAEFEELSIDEIRSQVKENR